MSDQDETTLVEEIIDTSELDKEQPGETSEENGDNSSSEDESQNIKESSEEEKEEESSEEEEKEEEKKEGTSEEEKEEKEEEEGETGSEEEGDTTTLRNRKTTIKPDTAPSKAHKPPKKSYSTNEVPSWLRAEINKFVPNRLLLIFLIIWSPFLIMATGSLFGALIFLIFQNFHYLVGCAAGIYVWILAMDSPSEAEKNKLPILMIASVLPIFMLEETNFFFKLVTMAAFSGTPFLLERFFPYDAKKDDGSEKTSSTSMVAFEQAMMYGAGPAVIFALSIGCEGITDVIVLCTIYAGASFIAQKAVNPILSAIPEPYGSIVGSYRAVFLAVLQLKLAHLILLTLGWLILPEGLIAHHNSFWLAWLYSFIGNWHPLRAIIVSVSTSGLVYIWATNYTENWSAFAPDFTELEENVEYVEKEDEFDIVDEEVKKRDENGTVDVDISTIDEIKAYSSDSEEDLWFLPTTPCPDNSMFMGPRGPYIPDYILLGGKPLPASEVLATPSTSALPNESGEVNKEEPKATVSADTEEDKKHSNHDDLHENTVTQEKSTTKTIITASSNTNSTTSPSIVPDLATSNDTVSKIVEEGSDVNVVGGGEGKKRKDPYVSTQETDIIDLKKHKPSEV